MDQDDADEADGSAYETQHVGVLAAEVFGEGGDGEGEDEADAVIGSGAEAGPLDAGAVCGVSPGRWLRRCCGLRLRRDKATCRRGP